jgi:hypothetical protein
MRKAATGSLRFWDRSRLSAAIAVLPVSRYVSMAVLLRFHDSD